MSTSVLDIRRRLDGLSASDENYRPLLLELLSHKSLKPHIHGLQGSSLQGFVELLDEALNHIPVTDDLFGKTLRRLQSTCSNREVLPGSYLIQNEKLSGRGMPIAAGDFADIYEAEFGGKKVCIKTLRSYVQDTGGVINKIFYGEVVVWKRLRHPNIVPFLGVPTKIPPPFEIVCEWIENGTISEYVRKYPRVDRVELLWDVANGLHYLHSCGIIHGNLKGANVLIDKNGHARLTDFGLTSIGREDNTTRTSHDLRVAGMTTWAAPEILRGEAVTKEGDVFTFAMVAVETFTGHSPFVTTYQAALYGIMSGKRPRRPETLNKDGLWELIQRCWDQDPGKRPTTPELLEFFRASVPGEREIPKAQALRSAPSSWTLKDTEVHVERDSTSRLDPHRQLGPQDPSVGNQRMNGPESAQKRGLSEQGTQPIDELPVGDPDDRVDVPLDTHVSTTGSPGTAPRVPEGDPVAPSSFLSQLGRAFRAKFAAMKAVVSPRRSLNGREPAGPVQGSRGIGFRRDFLPIIGIRRYR